MQYGLILIALLIGSCAKAEPALDDLIEQNTVANGGAVALDRISALEERSTITEPEYTTETIFVSDRTGRMRIDIYYQGERVFAESFDGEHGYQWRPADGQTNSSEEGTIALSHTPQFPGHIFRLKDMPAQGHSLTYVESFERAGQNLELLQLVLSDGFTTYLYLDPASGLIVGSRSTRALHVDVDASERQIEVTKSDFEETEGVLWPRHIQEADVNTGDVLVDVVINDVVINPEITEDFWSNLTARP